MHISDTPVITLPGPAGVGLMIENVVDIRRHNNTEFILRVETDVMDQNIGLCSDMNGFQVSQILMLKSY